MAREIRGAEGRNDLQFDTICDLQECRRRADHTKWNFLTQPRDGSAARRQRTYLNAALSEKVLLLGDLEQDHVRSGALGKYYVDEPRVIACRRCHIAPHREC